MTVVYWIAAIIGALAVLWLIQKFSPSKNEGFEAIAQGEGEVEQTGGDVKENFGNAKVENYREDFADTGFPAEKGKLALYLSAFSERVSYLSNEEYPLIYESLGATGLWRDFTNKDNNFSLQVIDVKKGKIPSKIKTRKDGAVIDIGLPLQSVKLVGPSSKALGEKEGATTAFELTPFTAAFYGTLDNLDFEQGETRKVLFRITAENPDLIEIAIRRRDNRNVLIEVILGDSGRAFQWVVDKYMLMSNRLPTLYALTYNKGDTTDSVESPPSITLYIGKTKLQKNFSQSDAPSTIRLGNSEIILNPTGQVNMTLVAFAYFKSALDSTAISDLGKYFTQQLSGIDLLISERDEQYAAITAELKKKLEDASRTLYDAEDELKQCKAAAEAALKAAPRVRQWQVSLDGTGAAQATSKLTDEDLQKCAPLALVGKLARITSKLPDIEDPTKKAAVAVKPAPFKKVSASSSATPDAPASGLKEPDVSLSDPNSSLWERMNASFA